jgi:hypothetical protein
MRLRGKFASIDPGRLGGPGYSRHTKLGITIRLVWTPADISSVAAIEVISCGDFACPSHPVFWDKPEQRREIIAALHAWLTILQLSGRRSQKCGSG